MVYPSTTKVREVALALHTIGQIKNKVGGIRKIKNKVRGARTFTP